MQRGGGHVERRGHAHAPPCYKRPEWRNDSANYWKSIFRSCDMARREGWRRYYDEMSVGDRGLQLIRMLDSKCEIPVHIKTEYRKLVSQQDASKRECPICMGPVNFDDSELTDCGHIFHAQCLKQALARNAVCPMCRTARPVKKWEIPRQNPKCKSKRMRNQSEITDHHQ